MSMLVTLDAESVDAIARRVVELLDAPNRLPIGSSGLVDATTFARLLGVSRSTVYEHAERLGAIEVGDGDRPRLRFDAEKARAAWSARTGSKRSQPAQMPASAQVRRRRRRAQSGSGARLLPVKGQEAA
jgi:hypothetical protein